MVRILVVEDEALVSIMVCDMLEELDHTVIGPAATIRQALELVDTEEFDMALLDVGLPDGPVFPLARKLRERKIPYAFATGYHHVDDSEFSQDPILQKPYSFSNLEDVVTALLTDRILQAA